MDRVVFLNEIRFRNDGPPLYLGSNFEAYKDELGINTVEHYVPVEKDNPKGHPSTWGKVDLYIWVDFGDDALGQEYMKCPKPNVYWCSDSHLGMEYRLNKAKEFDYVFVSIPRHIDKFKEAVGHDRVYWLPHAGEPTVYFSTQYMDKFKPYFQRFLDKKIVPSNGFTNVGIDIDKNIAIMKQYEVCFIGHLPNEERIELLDNLFKVSEVQEFYFGQKFFHEANEIYNRSKIVFNHCIDKEANMRVFEGTLSGSLVLNNYSEEVEQLGYRDGENIVFYRSPEEMVEKVKYYLANEEERERIAKAGMEHTLTHHIYLHRAKQILGVIKNDKIL